MISRLHTEIRNYWRRLFVRCKKGKECKENNFQLEYLITKARLCDNGKTWKGGEI
jgi:hypothetical protein